MKQKELKKLRRSDLLEILIEQGKEIERLEKELAKANRALNSRKITYENAGSLAEAALMINHIFEDADAAAKQYVENVKRKAKKELKS